MPANLLQIPRAFTESPKILQVLETTLYQFNYEEQSAIYLYHVSKTPIKEIAELTKLKQGHVKCTLALYLNRLELKLNVFEQAVSYNPSDTVSVGELLELGIQ